MSPAKETAKLPDPGAFAKRDVLVEYDGPQLAMFTSSKKALRIGTLVKAQPGREDWLVASVTRMEVEALADGLLPVHEAFEKDPLAIVGFERGKAKAIWQATNRADFEDALPVVGALLPADARAILQAKFAPKKGRASKAERRVRFDGRRIRESRIEFSALAKLIGSLQNLWTALAETIGIETVKAGDDYAPSALIADAKLASGSIAVALRPTDEAVFDAILARYHHTMRTTYGDIAEVNVAIDSENVRSRLREYLGALSDCEADALFEAPSARIYTGFARARVVRSVLRSSPKTAAPSRPAPKAEKLTKRGYFDGLEVSGNEFKFVDIESNETLTGTLGPGVADRIRAKTVRVGGSALFYRATFSTDGETTVLLDFDGLQGDFGF